MALLGQSGQVLEQYVWDPYGTPVVKHTSATPGPVNRVGHQGLFWHSLDGSATFNAPDPAANPTATGLYYNRNRWYAPHLGRFLQRDPNESGQLIAATLASNGEVLSAFAGAFDATSHFTDGPNLYAYQGSNPTNRVDPRGLLLGGLLGDTGTRTCLAAAAGGGAGSAYLFTSRVLGGMAMRDAAIEAACLGVMFFVSAPATAEVFFARSGVILLGSDEYATGGTAAASLLGHTFGKLGTVIANPRITISFYPSYFLNRMAERGVTQAMVDATVRAPLVCLRQSSGNIVYVTGEAVVIVSQAGHAVTTYSRAQFDSVIFGILKSIGVH